MAMINNRKTWLQKAINKAAYGHWPDAGAASAQLASTPEWSLGDETPFVMSLIYNKSFAQTIWGDGPTCAYCRVTPHMQHYTPCPEGKNIWPYLWEYHLQQMVISKDPLDYLNTHLYS
jgi:hypothetical protein